MSADELDEFLSQERVCRVATVSHDGPHVSPLWFVWDGTALWLYSILKSQRLSDLRRDPRVSVIVDGGHDYRELRGAELIGRAALVGESPRVGDPCPELAEPERLFATKYAGGELVLDGRHAWLRLTPDKVVSWDFRKLPDERQRLGS